MVWWLPVLGMHFKRWKWLPEEKNDQKIKFLDLLWNDRAAPLREDDVASLKVQLVYQVIGFGLWWCIKVRRGGLIGVAESFGGHGKTVRQCVQNQGCVLDPISVWIFHASFPHRNPPYWNPRFSVCIKSRVRPWIWTFLCHVETIQYYNWFQR